MNASEHNVTKITISWVQLTVASTGRKFWSGDMTITAGGGAGGNTPYESTVQLFCDNKLEIEEITP